ncbi:aminomethyl transferase family protein [Halobellus sp. GM3]|uniref:aminomethyl transferase family protein n=1 Tax=Halobellus sp. GM3 TaxID=3458410 RepID=UPI00403E1325
MCANNVDELVRESDNIVEMLRGNATAFTLGEHFPAIPNEITNWIEEQRAIIESVALGDLSHHMTEIHAEGPDAFQFFKDFSVNSFENFEVGDGKHIVLCNARGHLIGDGPLLRLGEEEFWGVPWGAENWLEYQLDVGDYDVTASFDPPTAKKDGGDPESFIIQVQGPDAYATLSKLTDADIKDIGFYKFREITLAGKRVRAFGHGMSTQPGFEFHGPFEHADEIKSAILEAGEEFGIRHLGSKAYNSQSVRLGWIGAGPPPVYDGEEMADFRQWLGTDRREASFSIEGSYDSDDITDYYMTPVEYGFGGLVDFDHDYVGREALREQLDNQQREFVSLLWDDDDMVDVYASLYGDGTPNKYFELPRSRWGNSAFDSVTRDGELVGISRRRSYEPDIRGVASLAVVDLEHSEPGTEVTVHWGEGRGSVNPRIEDHEPTEVSATVAPVPYTEDLRKA